MLSRSRNYASNPSRLISSVQASGPVAASLNNSFVSSICLLYGRRAMGRFSWTPPLGMKKQFCV